MSIKRFFIYCIIGFFISVIVKEIPFISPLGEIGKLVTIIPILILTLLKFIELAFGATIFEVEDKEANTPTDNLTDRQKVGRVRRGIRRNNRRKR